MGLEAFTLDNLKNICGEMKVTPLEDRLFFDFFLALLTLFFRNKKVNKWAGLGPVDPMSLGKFISEIDNATSHLYVHDESLESGNVLENLHHSEFPRWHIIEGCPAILSNFTMPKYFVNDYLQRYPMEIDGNRTRYWMMGDARQWPSLFIGSFFTFE